MNATARRSIRRLAAAIRSAVQLTPDLLFALIDGDTGRLAAEGHLIRTGDYLGQLGAADLKDGYQSWYGRHVADAYREANDGANPLRVWARHRTTRRWIQVFVYAPSDPALIEGLKSYKRTRHLVPLAASYSEAA